MTPLARRMLAQNRMRHSPKTTHWFAKDLVGFPSTTLRVRVTERRDGYVWCRTADLQSAGVPLVLNAAQVTEVARD